MKRFALILMCVAGMVLCAGCGNKGGKKAENKDGKADIEKVADKLMKEAFEGDKYSKEAAEYYFKKNEGIKLSDLAPEYKLNETSKYTYYGDERDALANFKIQDGDTYTKEQHVDNVRRIYALTKKVADKLSGMCKTDKGNYEKYWEDISPFIKYGCLKDDKFCEKMNDYILFKNLEGNYMTLPECLETKPIDVEEATDEEGNTVEAEVIEPEEKEEEAKEDEKKEKIIYFVTDPVEQSQYVAMFKKAKMDAVMLTDNIDMPFINQLEMKNEGVIFKRIDEDLSDALKTKNSAKVEEELKANEEELAKLFKKIVKKDNIKVKLEKLKNKDISAMMTMSGETRKMQEMMRMYASGMGIDEFSKEGLTLVLNANNKLVQFLIEEKEGENVGLICEQLFDLALIQHGPLSPDEMTKFVNRSNKIMMILAK